MKKLLVLLYFSAECWAEPTTGTGEMNGARFRIDVPESWNGGLVMYCHGYSPVPVDFSQPPPQEAVDFLGAFLDQGFAVAQSGYASTGRAIQDAVQDTEALRRYFASRHGPPKETYVTGHSMGGFLPPTESRRITR